MARKTKKIFNEEQFKLLAYKWEFLRRNDDYRDDFMRFSNLSESEQGIKAGLSVFIEKYGILQPFSPEISFLDFLSSDGEFVIETKLALTRLFLTTTQAVGYLPRQYCHELLEIPVPFC